MLKRVLKRQGKNCKVPLTLIVLDEVQIYIGDSQDRAGAIAEISETLAKEFDSQVMLRWRGPERTTRYLAIEFAVCSLARSLHDPRAARRQRCRDCHTQGVAAEEVRGAEAH